MPRRAKPLSSYNPMYKDLTEQLAPDDSQPIIKCFPTKTEAQRITFQYYNFRNCLRGLVEDGRADESVIQLHRLSEQVGISAIDGPAGPKTCLEFFNEQARMLRFATDLGLRTEQPSPQLVNSVMQHQRAATPPAPSTPPTTPSTSLPVDDGTLTDAQLMELQYGKETPTTKPSTPAGVPAAPPPPAQGTASKTRSLDNWHTDVVEAYVHDQPLPGPEDYDTEEEN